MIANANNLNEKDIAETNKKDISKVQNEGTFQKLKRRIKEIFKPTKALPEAKRQTTLTRKEFIDGLKTSNIEGLQLETFDNKNREKGIERE